MHFAQSRTISMSELFSVCKYHGAGRKTPFVLLYNLKCSTMLNCVKMKIKQPSFTQTTFLQTY